MMGSRTLSTDCTKCGLVNDWGDFGPDPDDGSVGIHCACPPPPSLDEFQSAINRLSNEGRLDCVAKGAISDGASAKLCPEFIRHHEQMCAGCAAQRLVSAPSSDNASYD